VLGKQEILMLNLTMKPLVEKGYTNQALEKRKGINWLDDCRMPYSRG